VNSPARRFAWAAAVAAGLMAGLGGSAFANNKPRNIPLGPQAIEIVATPIRAFRGGAPDTTRFGSLEWVGGLSLSSSHRAFGGLSGLAFLDTTGHRFLAASDGGVWVEATIATEGERPVGVGLARLAPMQNERGESLAGSGWGDAEAVVVRGDHVFASFEDSNLIRRFDRRDTLSARGFPVSAPAGIKRLRRSRGLEALALFPPGTRHADAFLAVGESPIRGEAHLSAWILGGPTPARFAIVHRDDFHATDAAILPNGDILLLERRVSPPFGLWSRIRRLPGAGVTAGALLDGPVIFEADLGHAIDNMEGIALHRGADGATYVTLISDDNYSILQRTLLLRFRLVE